MKVLLFAQSRLAAGTDECILKPDGVVTQAEFWTLLEKTYPALAAHRKSARLARNGAYLEEGEFLHPDDEIAVIPPVSGG